MLSFALTFALGNVMDLGWAALIVAVLWAIVAAVLYVAARRQGQARLTDAATDHGDAEGGREMAEEPDQIRDDIELTRARLAHDVDRLADKTSPARVAQRGWTGAKAKVRGMSDRVMGSARESGGTRQGQGVTPWNRQGQGRRRRRHGQGDRPATSPSTSGRRRKPSAARRRATRSRPA